MKLLAITITYHPDIRDLRDNILRYIDYVDRLIVWENSIEETSLENALGFESALRDKILFMTEGNNYGIAYPANKAVEYASNNGYSHILFMDQDSRWANFKSYKETIDRIDSSTEVFYPTYKVGPEQYESYYSSGCIVPIDVFRKVGLFREDYAIDCVDFEFAYRCEKYGIKQTNLPDLLVHSLGNPEYHGKYCTKNYSPFRLYHIARNNMMMWKEYRNANIPHPPELGDFFKIYSIIIKNMLYFESHKLSKLTSVLRGLFDGLIYSPKRAQIRRLL